MNKFGVVLGVAAVVTLAGCKDPNYQRADDSSAKEVKSVDTTVTTPVDATPVEVTPIAVEPVTRKCTCPPGMKHTTPCMCGDPDCKCVVETKPVIVVPDPVQPPKVDAEYTIYIVQSGDYLSKISKRFNVTINSIKRLNPSIKKDVIRVGQKLKLPGKVDVGVQAAPVVAPSFKPAAATSAKSSKKAAYTGATKEYVVKNGDTLGSIAYGNGINIRQLKSLNGLTSDSLKIGQKLKIPAEKVAPKVKVQAADAKKADAVDAAVAPAKADAIAAPAEKLPSEAAVAPAVTDQSPVDNGEAKASDAVATQPAAGEKAPEKAAPATTTYVVQEGDDMTGVSIRFGVSAADIRDLNNLGETDQLVPGQIIKLPADAQQ